MPGLQSTTAFLESLGRENPFGEAQVAAAAFLARYSGRTLDAYRFDLRSFFQWATDAKLPVLDATRPHIELYRTTLEERGLVAPTIDRRLSTVCGFYRFAHIDGRISSNPAQYVRRPKVYPSEGRGMDRGELGTFLFTAERFDRDHAALSVLLGRFPVSLMCRRVTHSIGVCGQSRTRRALVSGYPQSADSCASGVLPSAPLEDTLVCTRDPGQRAQARSPGSTTELPAPHLRPAGCGRVPLRLCVDTQSNTNGQAEPHETAQSVAVRQSRRNQLSTSREGVSE